MITLYFGACFISESLAMPREEDFLTRAEAQCLQAVREETSPLQKFNKIINFQDLKIYSRQGREALLN